MYYYFWQDLYFIIMTYICIPYKTKTHCIIDVNILLYIFNNEI